MMNTSALVQLQSSEVQNTLQKLALEMELLHRRQYRYRKNIDDLVQLITDALNHDSSETATKAMSVIDNGTAEMRRLLRKLALSPQATASQPRAALKTSNAQPHAVSTTANTRIYRGQVIAEPAAAAAGQAHSSNSSTRFQNQPKSQPQKMYRGRPVY